MSDSNLVEKATRFKQHFVNYGLAMNLGIEQARSLRYFHSEKDNFIELVKTYIRLFPADAQSIVWQRELNGSPKQN